MPKQLPPWATRLIAFLLLAGTYILHHAGIIPPTLEWHHINILGLISDTVTGAAAIGISGPSLWPQLAAFLGNPSAGAVNDAAKAVGAPVPTAKGPTS
jgi:hypothetical protein